MTDAPRGQSLTVGAERDSSEILGLATEVPRLLPGFHVPKLHHLPVEIAGGKDRLAGLRIEGQTIAVDPGRDSTKGANRLAGRWIDDVHALARILQRQVSTVRTEDCTVVISPKGQGIP